MRDFEWDNIQEGDSLSYLPPPTKQNPNPTPIQYLVFKLVEGKVQAIRYLTNQNDEKGTSFAQTEVALIEANSDRWTYVLVKAKVAVTGGFIVKRAATGREEYDKCPTDLDRSRNPTRRSV
jgi:hypothetical protein